MTINTLSTAASITPVVIKTFFKHFYDQARKAREDKNTEPTDELLFAEAFSIVRKFCDVATHDTVESLQAFTNTYVPPPPWATAVSVLIPLESCDAAAKVLIEYFGPELETVVGGSKWWQVRGIAGVEAEWIAQTSDWKLTKHLEETLAEERDTAGKEKRKPDLPKAERKAKQKQRETQRHAKSVEQRSGDWKDQTVGKVVRIVRRNPTEAEGKKEPDAEEGLEWEEMDLGEHGDMDESAFEAFEHLDRLKRVLLYCHGGAYYWGSINTHRYQIIRYARKFGGRAFAVNYRKAPNYPWPCPVHDLLAAYLYLIRPPPGAKHRAVEPAHLVIAGDSAGGGMCLALLTLLRDMNLPMPAGAVLISPWCDMTHSFPSVMKNTATDIIPPYGFVHKPSTLWPVPGVLPDNERKQNEQDDAVADRALAGKPVDADRPLDSVPAPLHHLYSKPIEIRVTDPALQKEWGDKLTLKDQIQQYATNDQLTHPLCSPVVAGSLGGLPPLYILAGNGEVLRDEIIYLAHRAARPSQYPAPKHILDNSARAREAQAKFDRTPTKVHFQLFDQMCHVLTVFSFTTQAKFAYRAISSFVKHVTGAPTSYIEPFPGVEGGKRKEQDVDATLRVPSKDSNLSAGALRAPPSAVPSSGSSNSSVGSGEPPQSRTLLPLTTTDLDASGETVDSPVAQTPVTPSRRKETLRQERRWMASSGVQNEYSGAVPLLRPSFHEYMIRERVGVRGGIRPMEVEAELKALQVPSEEIGIIKQAAAVRYMTGQKLWAKKYKASAKRVSKRRAKNEERAARILKQAVAIGRLREEQSRSMAVPFGAHGEDSAWKTDANHVRYGPTDLAGEKPPPSAIAGRRDTEDAIGLLRTSLYMQKHLFSKHVPKQSASERQRKKQRAKQSTPGIALWSTLMTHLSRRPHKNKKSATSPEEEDDDDDEEEEAGQAGVEQTPVVTAK